MSDYVLNTDWSRASQVRLLRQLADLVESGEAMLVEFRHSAEPNSAEVELKLLVPIRSRER